MLPTQSSFCSNHCDQSDKVVLPWLSLPVTAWTIGNFMILYKHSVWLAWKYCAPHRSSVTCKKANSAAAFFFKFGRIFSFSSWKTQANAEAFWYWLNVCHNSTSREVSHQHNDLNVKLHTKKETRICKLSSGTPSSFNFRLECLISIKVFAAKCLWERRARRFRRKDSAKYYIIWPKSSRTGSFTFRNTETTSVYLTEYT